MTARFMDPAFPDPATDIDQHFQYHRAFQTSATCASRILGSWIGPGCRFADAVARSLGTGTRLGRSGWRGLPSFGSGQASASDGFVCRGFPGPGSGWALVVHAVALVWPDLCRLFRLVFPGYRPGLSALGCLSGFLDLGRGNLSFLRHGMQIWDHLHRLFIGLRLTGPFLQSRSRGIRGADRGIFRLLLDRCNRLGVRGILGLGLRYLRPCHGQGDR